MKWTDTFAAVENPAETCVDEVDILFFIDCRLVSWYYSWPVISSQVQCCFHEDSLQPVQIASSCLYSSMICTAGSSCHAASESSVYGSVLQYFNDGFMGCLIQHSRCQAQQACRTYLRQLVSSFLAWTPHPIRPCLELLKLLL